jgi:hypothetical protein
MGNKQLVYIVGEVDFKQVRLNQPLFRKGNIYLRYPQVTVGRPKDLSVNYGAPLRVEHYSVPREDIVAYCYDGMELKSLDQTRVVMLEGYQNLFGYTDLKVVDSAVVQIAKNSAMK